MMLVRSNFHALHVLNVAEQRLCKALIYNCNKELVKCISECVLNVLNGNIKLLGCNMPKLKKYMSAFRKVADRNVSLSGKKRLIVQRGGFLVPLMSSILPTIGSLISKRA